MFISVSDMLATSIPSALMTEAGNTSETSVKFYHNTSSNTHLQHSFALL
jgi:hypothetical protein